jgi:diacylglycerol kinase family enzyme
VRNVQVRVVVNCGAGSVDDEATREQRGEIAAAFESAGSDCDIEFVAGRDMEAAVRRAIEAEPEVVAVAGGDGSVGTAAAVLAGGDTPLGVVPLGTFNHFAKDLGVPLDMGQAATTIVGGQTARVDVVDLNGHCFVNNSSIGVYPAMVGVRERIRDERGWGKVRAAPVALWHVLRRFPVRSLCVEADGYRAELRTPFVFVGNDRYDVGPAGLGARARLDEGQLCVYVAHAASRRKLLAIALRSMLRGSATVPGLEEHCAPAVTIDAHGHRLLVAIDGEVVTLRSPLEYRSRPRALPVRVGAGFRNARTGLGAQLASDRSQPSLRGASRRPPVGNLP